jgi:hypothetical protein
MELRKIATSEKGQTMVEYILLLAVAVSLVTTVYRSQAFRKLFGEQGEIGKKMKTQNEFAYRHAFYTTGAANATVSDVPRNNKDISVHPSYKEPGAGTRFFGPKEPYGD